jgi:hypothetical protein
MQQPKEIYHFDISLSVLNHLGRNLYRNFITVLGEAISNSWDANAQNVWIDIDQESSVMVIKDDGDGMNESDFQGKFLKIGYSKRKDPSNNLLERKRPFIGRKGIGKLALLSCAKTVEIISKTSQTEYTGGTIDNSGLDRAIDDDESSAKYPLGSVDMSHFRTYASEHDKGTIIYFSELNEGISNTLDYLRKAVALYFRFSLIDPTFNIFINSEKITVNNIQSLADNTQFLWTLNDISVDKKNDPFLEKLKVKAIKQAGLSARLDISGFIASVNKPKDLKIFGTDGEKIGVDLFVNGRLREKDILSHMQSAQVPQSYMYGQIHFDILDEGDSDRFTSSREGVKADDDLFKGLLKYLKGTMATIYSQWDSWRLDVNQDGDDENTAHKSKKDRASSKLFSEIVSEYIGTGEAETDDLVKKWARELSNDAEFNFGSYGECFVSENIIRKYIGHKAVATTDEANREISKYKNMESQNKTSGHINIELRRDNNELSYLAMKDLANLVDKNNEANNLAETSKQYRPVRDALMHTAVLSEEAKRKLSTVYDEIKARIKVLLSRPDTPKTDG